MIKNNFLDKLLDAIDQDIGFIGIGTGSTTDATGTTLPNEALRKPVDTYIDGYTIIKEGFWDENEGNGITFTNTALFGGDEATSALGTGIARIDGAINCIKDNTQSLTVSIEITVEAVNT